MPRNSLDGANTVEVQLNEISTAPINKGILLFWDGVDHYEDGRMFENEDVPGKKYHVLFDGETLNTEPTHWALISFKK